MTVPKACILGIGGTRLSDRERAFFTETDPLGFILFERNCRTPEQVRSLAAELREISGRGDAPILIDQEGGRVARLKPPHWRAAPPAATFGRLHRADPETAARAVWLNARLIGAELHSLGINVDCAPVLDLPSPGADPIIGDRAFGADAGTAEVLGAAFRDGLNASGLLAVVKHMPGHGRANVDSHLYLPRVACPVTELAATDFEPFKALSGGPEPQFWAMTAHVVYEAVDPDNPATLSQTVIKDIIRGIIGFDGVLISDDLSMKALSGTLSERARNAVGAGCDLNLHCNGVMEEMNDVARETPEVSAEVMTKLVRSVGALREPQAFDLAAALAELESLIANAGLNGGKRE